MKRKLIAGAFGVAIVGGLICPSAANVVVTLPDAVWSLSGEAGGVGPPGNSCCASNQLSNALPGTVSASFTTFYGSPASVTVTGSANPFPSITVSASAGATSNPDTSLANAVVDLTYYVVLVGPTNTPAPPVDFISNGTVFSNNNGSNTTFVTNVLSIAQGYYLGTATSVGGITSLSVQASGLATGTIAPGVAPNSFVMLGQYQANVGSPLEVQMSTSVSVESAEQPTGLANGTFDPFFYIDPSFPDASQYSIIVSAGIGNAASAVPESSTWAMMLIGFAGLGIAGYRRANKFPTTLASTR